MGGFNPSQVSFAGGEVTPRLHGRVDADLYKRSLKTCTNFEPLAHGPARMRAGTEYVSTLPSDNTRIISFPTRSAGTFILELSALELRILNPKTMALEINSPDLVVGGTFNAAATGWTHSSETFTFFSLERSAGDYYVNLSRNVTGNLGWIRQSIAVSAGTTYSMTFELVGITASSTGIKVKVGTTSGGTEIHTELVTKYGFTTITFSSGAATTIWLEFTIENVVGNSVTLDNVQLRTAAGATVITTPWDTEHLAELCTAIETAKDRMIFAHGNVETRVLTRNPDGTWTLAAISSLITSKPGSWTGTNWPSVVEVYQSRLWLAATPDEGHRLWASKVGQAFDFSTTELVSSVATVTAACAIDLKIAAQGQIRWMRSGRSLLMGTDLGEHSVTSSSGAVTPLDIQVRDESAFGSCAGVPAVHAGEFAVYVSGDQRKLRALSYDLQTSGWNSRDVTFTGEHLTTGLIREVHHARDPNGTLVLLLVTGEVVLCTFQPSEQVAAWWTCETIVVRSAATTHGPLGSYIWMAVERDSGLLLERLPMHDSGVGHLDSSITGTVPVSGSITGLTHLEGLTVRVIVDDVLYPDQVVASGAVTVSAALAGKTYRVGLGFTAEMVQLPLEGGLATGSSQSARRRKTKVRLRLSDSALPLVNGNRTAERRVTDTMDTQATNVTGDVDANVLGWDENGALTITQDLPFRTEVLAIFGNAQANEV